MNSEPENAQHNSDWMFTPGSLGSSLDNLTEQVMVDKAKTSGLWELFQNSQRVPGFAEAKKGWLLAFRRFLQRHAFKRLDLLDNSSPQPVEEYFFVNLRANASSALVKFSPLVYRAAQKGDVDFFKRIAAELRGVSRTRPRATLELHILMHWMSCCLWLASDFAASTYLQQVTGKPVSESSYAKARQRLEKSWLLGYSIAHKQPLITGCTKQATFIFRDGWTDLVPSSSR